MSNIFAQAATDNANITGSTATSIAVTLTDSGATETEIQAHVYRIEEQIDPETGVRVYNPAVYVSYHPGSDPVVDETYTATVTVNGVAITGDVVNVRRDFTLGMVTFQVETA